MFDQPAPQPERPSNPEHGQGPAHDLNQSVSDQAESILEKIRDINLNRLNTSLPFRGYCLSRGDRRCEPREPWTRESAQQFARDISRVIKEAAPSANTLDGRLTPVLTEIPLDSQHPRIRLLNDERRSYSHFVTLRNFLGDCLLPFPSLDGKWRWQQIKGGEAALDCTIQCTLSRDSADKRNFTMTYLLDQDGFDSLIEGVALRFQAELERLRDRKSVEGSLPLTQILRILSKFYEASPQQILHAHQIEFELAESEERQRIHGYVSLQLEPWSEIKRCFLRIEHITRQGLQLAQTGSFTIGLRELRPPRAY